MVHMSLPLKKALALDKIEMAGKELDCHVMGRLNDWVPVDQSCMC